MSHREREMIDKRIFSPGTRIANAASFCQENCLVGEDEINDVVKGKRKKKIPRFMRDEKIPQSAYAIWGSFHRQ